LEVAGYGFGAVCGVEAPQNLSEVGFDGRLRYDESLRDRPVRQALGDECEDFLLARGQLAPGGGVVWLLVAASAAAQFGRLTP
jgi:hypothetical protein